MDLGKSVFLISFGQRLKELRKDRKLSLRQLSIRCNIDYSDISKIEKGKRNIQISTILELAKGLEIHPKELFDFNLEDLSCR
ncbi:helix-turn-helix transcriptional regulator [Algibacter lectus]|uniref:helix-turn-helix domain-containing protein n=1 Tax=Algibacter lectus TaxID=221126 RepID=UPI00126A44E0|nr:helix-turn-helix transcriptional regulator [Algibacter lectus]|tara:strand:- start:676 stop:921 length:246 start_codon:yes stop_codon:yes gene_type:complete